MKRIILIILLMQIGSSITYAAEHYTRIGMAFGGTGTLSFIVEHHIGGMSVRMNLGVVEFGEDDNVYSFAMSVNGYASDADTRPYAGIGILKILGADEMKPAIDIPIGMDFGFGNGHALDVEVDILYFTGRRMKGAPRYMPLPGFFYKYRL